MTDNPKPNSNLAVEKGAVTVASLSEMPPGKVVVRIHVGTIDLTKPLSGSTDFEAPPGRVLRAEPSSKGGLNVWIESPEGASADLRTLFVKKSGEVVPVDAQYMTSFLYNDGHMHHLFVL